MKKIIAWPLCHLCFIFGDLVARALNHIPDSWETTGSIGYHFYSTPMMWSVRLNDWAGLKVWE